MRNGNGVYVLPTGQPVVTGTTISSSTFNTLTTDLANALTTSIASDGQTAMTANLPMGGNKLTGLAAATVAGDAVRFEQAAASGANSDITSLLALGSINGGQLAGFRNRIINGNLSINQRAVSGTVTLAAGVYGHDRWKAGAGGCTYTFAASLNGIMFTITAGTLQQVIEGANLEGGTFKLSWVGTVTGRIDAGAYGASGVVGTAVAGTNQTVEFGTGTLARVQYELGSVATSFEQRGIGVELLLCQRYFSSLSNINVTGYAGASSAISLQLTLPIVMRVVPTMTILGTVSYINASALTSDYLGTDTVRLRTTVTAVGEARALATSGLTFNSDF